MIDNAGVRFDDLTMLDFNVLADSLEAELLERAKSSGDMKATVRVASQLDRCHGTY